MFDELNFDDISSYASTTGDDPFLLNFVEIEFFPVCELYRPISQAAQRLFDRSITNRVHYGANKLTIEAFKTSLRGIISVVIAIHYFLKPTTRAGSFLLCVTLVSQFATKVLVSG